LESIKIGSKIYVWPSIQIYSSGKEKGRDIGSDMERGSKKKEDRGEGTKKKNNEGNKKLE